MKKCGLGSLTYTMTHWETKIPEAKAVLVEGNFDIY